MSLPGNENINKPQKLTPRPRVDEGTPSNPPVLVRQVGFKPNKNTKRVPAPRLVGIEPNPGPTLLNPGVVAAAAAAGATAAKAIVDGTKGLVKGAGKALKKENKKVARKKQHKKQSKSSGRSLGYNNRLSSTALAPTSVGYVTQTRDPGTHIVEVPFDVISTNCMLVTGGAPLGTSEMRFGDTAHYYQHIPICPANNLSVGAIQLFGAQAGALCDIYASWRLKRLDIRYVSIKSTSTNGMVVMSASADPLNIPNSFAECTQQSPNFTVPAWGSDLATLDCKMFVAEQFGGRAGFNWYPTKATVTGQESRDWTPGTLSGWFVGFPAVPASTVEIEGYLRITGVIQFTSPTAKPVTEGSSSSSQIPSAPAAKICLSCNPQRSFLLPRNPAIARAVEGDTFQVIDVCNHVKDDGPFNPPTPPPDPTRDDLFVCEGSHTDQQRDVLTESHGGVTDATRVAMLENQLALIRAKFAHL